MKVFRDPIYDLIHFGQEKEDNPILKIIATPEFQRLRRIRQLGFSCYTYPTATHDRFSHSLGVSYVIGMLFDNLNVPERVAMSAKDGNGVELNRQILRLLLQLAGLLHDIGHGPFSHAFEKVTNFKHEKMSNRIIENESGNIYEILQSIEWSRYTGESEYEERQIGLIKDNFPYWITQIIGGKTFVGPQWIHDLLSSQLDADRIDYLLRDAYMCGVSYASFDLKWLCHSIAIGQKDNGQQSFLVIRAGKGLHAVESFIVSRYHMYEQVYFHKTTRGLESVFKALFERVKELGIGKNEYISAGLYNVINALKPESIDVNDFLMLDDFVIYTQLNQWKDRDELDSEGILQRLCKGIVDRDIYKCVRECEDRIDEEEGDKIKSYFTQEAEKQGHAGLAELYRKYYCLQDTYQDTPYKDGYVSGNLPETNQIWLEDKNKKYKTLSEASRIVGAMVNKESKRVRVYALEGHKEQLEKILISSKK